MRIRLRTLVPLLLLLVLPVALAYLRWATMGLPTVSPESLATLDTGRTKVFRPGCVSPITSTSCSSSCWSAAACKSSWTTQGCTGTFTVPLVQNGCGSHPLKCLTTECGQPRMIPATSPPGSVYRAIGTPSAWPGTGTSSACCSGWPTEPSTSCFCSARASGGDWCQLPGTSSLTPGPTSSTMSPSTFHRNRTRSTAITRFSN